MGDALWAIIGAGVAALAGTGVTALVSWIKSFKWIKKLNIEAAIDKAGELAIHYAESWGRKMSEKGTAKLNAAKEAFEAELKRQGIKLDSGDMEKRLEAIFNRIKTELEHPKKDSNA